jgi:hypothetical protein
VLAVPLVALIIVATPQQTDPVSQSTAPRHEKAAVRLGQFWPCGMQVLRFGISSRQQVLVFRLQLLVLPHACGPPSYGGGGGGASSEASAPELEVEEPDPELDPDEGWPPLLLDEPLLGWLPELPAAVPLLLVVPPLPLPLELPVLEPEELDDEVPSSPWKPGPPPLPHAANEKAAPTPTSNTANVNGANRRGLIRCSKARRLYLEWTPPGRTGLF